MSILKDTQEHNIRIAFPHDRRFGAATLEFAGRKIKVAEELLLTPPGS